jgi:hypothetical protein
MAVKNNRSNQFIQMILHSPVHGMLSSNILELSYRGRKSGKEYTLPVQYSCDGAQLTIVVGAAQKKIWWRNLRGSSLVHGIMAGKPFSGSAEVWEGESDAARIAAALVPYLQRFPGTARMYHLTRQADGSFNPEDINHAARSMVMVRVNLE